MGWLGVLHLSLRLSEYRSWILSPYLLLVIHVLHKISIKALEISIYESFKKLNCGSTILLECHIYVFILQFLVCLERNVVALESNVVASGINLIFYSSFEVL